MTAGVAAMLLGVFGVPIVLLWAGHRLRRRSPRWHNMFWGGLLGHLLSLVIGSIAAMMPAESWTAADVIRGALGLWSWLVLPVFGALVGALATRGQR